MQIKKFKGKTIKKTKTWLVINKVYKEKVKYLQPKRMKIQTKNCLFVLFL